MSVLMEFSNHIVNDMGTLMMAEGGGGLQTLWDKVLKQWLTPLYLAAIAVFAIMFLKDRAWMKLIAFVGIAAVVGVLVFMGKDFFGENKGLTKVAGDAAKDITVVSTQTLVH